jgi:hypothetical protein
MRHPVVREIHKYSKTKRQTDFSYTDLTVLRVSVHVHSHHQAESYYRHIFFLSSFFSSSTTLGGFWLAQVSNSGHFFLSKTLSFQSSTPTIFTSPRTLSSHLSSGPPFGLFKLKTHCHVKYLIYFKCSCLC